MKFEKIEPGMVLYDVHTYRMGNTALRSYGEWDVKVISVDLPSRTALVSWNGNAPSLWFENNLRKLRTKRTEFIAGFSGSRRPKPRVKKLPDGGKPS